MTELANDAVTTEDDEREVAFGWVYLAFLFVVFLVLALMAYSCDDDNTGSALTETVVTTVSESPAEPANADDLTPISLDATVADGRVTLSGPVPDEAARTQMLQIAEARYGAGNVVDELTIDAGTTIKGGTITVHGETTAGDDLPGLLADDFASVVGLTGSTDGVVYSEIVLSPVALTGNVALDKVALAGELPDQAGIDAVVAAATTTWGADNVDSSGLTIGENLTLEGGTMTVSGSIDAGDTRATDFAAAIETAVAGLTADAAGVTVDTSPEALARAEEKLTAALVAEPILFDSGSANISAESDAILERVAAAINAAPGINVEIVGHTDDQGSGAVNTALSADRASAVLDRLVELGVDAERLTSSGKGEAEPIADNATEEGRASNRRIEFLFEGAA